MSTGLLLYRVGDLSRKPYTSTTIPGYTVGYRQTFTVDGSQRVETWHEESGNSALDAAFSGTAPSSLQYWFGGYRGVETARGLFIPSTTTLTPPYEIWCACEIESLSIAQRLAQSTDASDIFQVASGGSSGAVRMRIDSTNRDVTPTGTVAADGTRYVIGVICDASGNLTCEVNGTVHDESLVDTNAFSIDQLGFVSAGADARLGAIYVYNSALLPKYRSIIRRGLDDFRVPTFASVGLSNTWDTLQGLETIGGVHGFHAASGFNSQPLKNWFDNIGSTGTFPWLTFINELNRTASGGHHHVGPVWFYVGISPNNMGESEATMRTWITDVTAEAVSQMNTAGHDGTNATFYFSPMANYETGVNCTIVSSGAYQRSVDLAEWAISNVTNGARGPILPMITLQRADDGDPTSPCHVDEPWKKDDGLCLHRFFDRDLLL